MVVRKRPVHDTALTLLKRRLLHQPIATPATVTDGLASCRSGDGGEGVRCEASLRKHLRGVG